VVANLSRFVQYAELDLSAFRGMSLVEMIGHSKFPAITERPYGLSLGPHAFYWFQLEPAAAQQESLAPGAGKLPVFAVASWEDVFSESLRARLRRVLPGFLLDRRWLRTRWRNLRSVEVLDRVPIPPTSGHLLVIRVNYSEGDPDFYVLPVAVATGERAAQILAKSPDLVMARLAGPEATQGVLYGAMQDSDFSSALLNAMARRRRIRGERGELVGSHTRAFRKVWGANHPALDAFPVTGEHTNTTINFGDRFLLKVFRKVEPGLHPEREAGVFLTDKVPLPLVAPFAGALEYRADTG
jgi:maltose alpha-D-glucosyltransferase/alpha-amylase